MIDILKKSAQEDIDFKLKYIKELEALEKEHEI